MILGNIRVRVLHAHIYLVGSGTDKETPGLGPQPGPTRYREDEWKVVSAFREKVRSVAI